MIQSNLIAQYSALTEGESDALVNAAQLCGLIKQRIQWISWVGFYWLKQDELVLGCYQGPVACSRIALSDGVCGASLRQNAPLRVADVHDFPGHIACDADTRSELVVPVRSATRVIGVFDLDSHIPEQFSAATEAIVVELVRRFECCSDLN